jgi:hypothetical protein
MTTNDSGPAFPACNEANVNGTMGMTLRDWFAGQALAGQCAASSLDGHSVTAAERARRVYQMADAMLAARGA